MPPSLPQRVVCPVEASLNGLLWNRSISPNSLLETTISEEVRPHDLEEEEGILQVQPPHLPSTTSRRHTLAEVSTSRFHQCSPPCIVVSPSDGASSDSCLKSSSNTNPPLSPVVGDFSSLLISGTGPGALGPAGTPLALSSNLLLQNQGSMLAASFQEGRRASDTSLTQGLKAFRQQLRKNTRAKGLLGLNKIKGLARQVCPPSSCSRGSRGSLGPTMCPPSSLQSSSGPRERRSMLEEVLHQQRMLQIQHQPQPQVQFLSQSHPSSPPSNNLFAPAALFSNPPTQAILPPCQKTSIAFQHNLWQQQQSFDSSSSSLSPVASAAHLLEARLHISQRSHLHPQSPQHLQIQPNLPSQGPFSLLPHPGSWSLSTSTEPEPDVQELICASQKQQLSNCVMVK